MTQKIRTILVDDEQEAINFMQMLIGQFCPEIEIIGTALYSDDAKNVIFKKHPDLVFLDIQMDEENGFDIVKKITQEYHTPKIVFVTAYEQYAIDAIKINAFDYLLKPVSKNELRRVVDKFMAFQKEKHHEPKKAANQSPGKLRFNTSGGFFLLAPSEILFCEADRNYSKIYTAPGKFKLVSMNLAELQRRLPESRFWRISRFHLVNSDYVSEVNRVKRRCYLKVGSEVLGFGVSKEFMF